MLTSRDWCFRYGRIKSKMVDSKMSEWLTRQVFGPNHSQYLNEPKLRLDLEYAQQLQNRLSLNDFYYNLELSAIIPSEQEVSMKLRSYSVLFEKENTASYRSEGSYGNFYQRIIPSLYLGYSQG